nr:hypothetical protein B0A51_12385 [Rachicladosporium sp. CCFEE 5018]
MEPISAIASIAGIVDAGTSLASYLNKRYKSYTNAPVLLEDLAQDVELCAGWVAVLVSHLEQPNPGHSPKFTKDAGKWAKQTGAIFTEIKALVPVDRDMDRTFSRGKWEYVRNEKKLGLAQEKLKTKQFNFMFMEAMYRSVAPPHSATGSSRDPNSMSSAGGLGDVQGPLLLSGFDGSGKRFEVRMHLTAVPEISGRSTINSDVPVVGTTSRKKVTRDIDRAQERRLVSLAQSPLFDPAVSGKARRDGRSANLREAVSRHGTRKHAGYTEDDDDDLEIKGYDEAMKAEIEVEELRRRATGWKKSCLIEPILHLFYPRSVRAKTPILARTYHIVTEALATLHDTHRAHHYQDRARIPEESGLNAMHVTEQFVDLARKR